MVSAERMDADGPYADVGCFRLHRLLNRSHIVSPVCLLQATQQIEVSEIYHS